MKEALVTPENNNMKTNLYIIILFTWVLIQPGFGQRDDSFNYEYALIEAARQKTIGNINESIKLYQKCLEENPESALVYYELGSIYIALNQPDISEKLLRRAYELESDNYWYVLAYSQILNFQKEYKLLAQVLKDYLKIDNNLRIKFSLANAYHNIGKERRALRILEGIEKNKGISEQVLLKKVEIYKQQKKFDKGEKELKKLLRIFPEAPEYNIIMAEFLEETSRMEKAVKFYKRAYQLDSTNLYAISNLADYYTGKGIMEEGLYFLNRAFTLDDIKLEKKLSTIVYFLGKDELVKNNRKEFEEVINTLMSKYPDNTDILSIAYDFHREGENFQDAYMIIRSLLEKNKDNYMLWQQAIYTASMLNKYNDIMEMGNEALTIFPNKKELKLFTGIAYFQNENFEQAYTYLVDGYESGLDMGVQIQFLTFLAESSYKLKKVDESFYYFEELLLLQPDNYMVMNNYSYYMALEEITLERAEELSRKAINEYPQNPTYLDTYAWILFKLNRYEEAYDYISKAVAKEIEDPDVYFHYAWILCKTGDKERSGEYFKKAQNSGFSDIEEIRKGLKSCEE